MYVCGPTVYNYAHIGNARPVVVFDVLFRLLRHLYGEDHVLYAANVTDVDDKINARPPRKACRSTSSPTRYLEAYNADMAAAGRAAAHLPAARHPDHGRDHRHDRPADRATARPMRPKATCCSTLRPIPTTASSRGRSMDDMIAGARVDVAPYKRHPADFVLWKPSKPGEPVWDEPLRPRAGPAGTSSARR